MHVEPTVEAALQECHVQELLEPSPHLNAAMEVGITHPKIKLFGNSTDVYFPLSEGAGTGAGKCPGGYSQGARGTTSKGPGGH